MYRPLCPARTQRHIPSVHTWTSIVAVPLTILFRICEVLRKPRTKRWYTLLYLRICAARLSATVALTQPSYPDRGLQVGLHRKDSKIFSNGCIVVRKRFFMRTVGIMGTIGVIGIMHCSYNFHCSHHSHYSHPIALACLRMITKIHIREHRFW